MNMAMHAPGAQFTSGLPVSVVVEEKLYLAYFCLCHDPVVLCAGEPLVFFCLRYWQTVTSCHALVSQT